MADDDHYIDYSNDNIEISLDTLKNIKFDTNGELTSISQDKIATLHKNFIKIILKNSIENYNFKIACLEWRVIDKYTHNPIEDEGRLIQCVCTNPILYCFKIQNNINNNILFPVGSSCVTYIDTPKIKEDLEYYKGYDKITSDTFDHNKKKYCICCLKTIHKRDMDYCKGNEFVYYCNDCNNNINYNYIDKFKYLLQIKYKNNPLQYELHKNDLYNINTLKVSINDTEQFSKNKIKFGKYKGISYRELIEFQLNYCNWICNNLDYNKNQNLINYLKPRYLMNTKYKKYLYILKKQKYLKRKTI
jgi:hypothetical protein